jgi:putative hemolysin
MSNQGSIFSDVIFLGLCLLLLIGLAWWVMPESLERDIARAMQGALPLGDAVVIEYDHALSHGAEALAVRECLKKDGPFSVWQKPDGRFVRLCQLPDGKFGTQICAADYNGRDCFHEITSFIKNKFTRLEQLIKYLENIGATQVWP